MSEPHLRSDALSRREAMTRAILGAGFLALGGATLAAASRPAAATVRLRRDITRMTADDPVIRTFRAGVGEMRARSERNPLDPLGWHMYGAQHSIFCATNAFKMQIHYGWFFLPWHRAYLLNLEEKIRKLTGDRDFAMPYWNWTEDRRLPAVMFGPGNPLDDTTRIYKGGEAFPADFAELGPALRAGVFRQFAGLARRPGSPQVEGTLEQGAHNNIHNWIGGNMASFDGAGFDPIFGTHHGNIDRMWEIWKAADPAHRDPDDPEWLEHRFALYGADGKVEQRRVRDLLDTRAIGYSYDSLGWRSVLADASPPEYPGGGQTVATLRLNAAERAAVRRGAARGKRALIEYRRIQLPVHPLCHRIFLLHPADARSASIDAATYCGTFTLLPIPDLEHGLDPAVNTQFEVPDAALDALLAERPVHVTIVPVPLRDRTIPTEPLRLDGVQLTLES